MNDVGFTIVNYDLIGNSILVRPYSTSFKNPASTYPIYNISISNLDASMPIEPQIASYMISITRNIVSTESDDYKTISDFLFDNVNSTYSLPLSSLIPREQVAPAGSTLTFKVTSLDNSAFQSTLSTLNINFIK